VDESQVPIGDGRPEAEGVPQVVDPAALPELTGDGFVQDAGPRQLPKPLGPRRWTHTFVALLAASLAGSLALIPFTWTLLKSANAALIPESLFPLIMVFTVILELLISAASIGIGLALGPSAKLGQMVVSVDGGIEPSARRRLRMWIVEPLARGWSWADSPRPSQWPFIRADPRSRCRVPGKGCWRR